MQDELSRLKEHCERLEQQNAELLEREREWASIRHCKRDAPDYAREDIEAEIAKRLGNVSTSPKLAEAITYLQAAAINFETDWIPVRVVTKLHRGDVAIQVECKLQKPHMYDLEIISIDKVT